MSRFFSCLKVVFFSSEAKGALSRLFRNMASRKKCGLTDEEILNLVFDSDQESDVCDEDDVLLDNGDCQTDESGSDEENLCSADASMDASQTFPKKRRIENWR